MQVVVTGGTGFIGSRLCQVLLEAGHQLVVLSRNPSAAQQSLGSRVQAVHWDPSTALRWQGPLESTDAVIHLAGESIAERRWTSEQLERIRSSRVDATRRLVEAIATANPRPKVLVSAS